MGGSAHAGCRPSPEVPAPELERVIVDRWRNALRGAVSLLEGRAIAERPALRRLVFPFRDAPFVTDPLRFIGNELLKRRCVTRHRVRGTPFIAHLRHPYHDIWVLDEIFANRIYAPPAPVLATLEALGRPLRILDVGSHVGLASLFFLCEFPGASIRAYEPDPHNASILRRTVASNAFDGRFTVVEAAAGVKEGTIDFVSDYHLSRLGVSTDETTFGVRVPLVDVLPSMDEADLVKLDIQGGEWEVLSDPRAARLSTRAMVLEYHPYLAPGPDPHAEAARLLRAAGFEVGEPFEVHAGEGTVWAWKPHA